MQAPKVINLYSSFSLLSFGVHPLDFILTGFCYTYIKFQQYTLASKEVIL